MVTYIHKTINLLLNTKEQSFIYVTIFCYSLGLVKFSNQGDQLFLIVGVAKEFQLNPRVSNGGFLYTYKLVQSLFNISFCMYIPYIHIIIIIYIYTHDDKYKNCIF